MMFEVINQKFSISMNLIILWVCSVFFHFFFLSSESLGSYKNVCETGGSNIIGY